MAPLPGPSFPIPDTCPQFLAHFSQSNTPKTLERCNPSVPIFYIPLSHSSLQGAFGMRPPSDSGLIRQALGCTEVTLVKCAEWALIGHGHLQSSGGGVGAGPGRQAPQQRSQGLWLLPTRWNSGQWQALYSEPALAPSLLNSAHSLGVILTRFQAPCPKVFAMPGCQNASPAASHLHDLAQTIPPLSRAPASIPFSSSRPTPPGSLLQCLAQSRVKQCVTILCAPTCRLYVHNRIFFTWPCLRICS